MSATTSSQPSTAHDSNPEEPVPTSARSSSLTVNRCDQTSTSNSNDPRTVPPKSGKPPRRKQPMKDFKWGGNLVRKTLPVRVIPRWLDPSHVDVADPTELPLCWYGVPFVRSIIYPYTERIGVPSYYDKELLRAKTGDLDVFQTWANMEEWFKEQSGLKLDLNLVWGHPTPILTFLSNRELPITREQMDRICDLLDDMEYDEDYEPMWYLDRNLDVRRFRFLRVSVGDAV
ncbi:hypothetical protein GSI_14740 [Ganoderma sinense ZZ0214-1]|uniref:Uncharacterized protein n=1 Tax=Ganoderma sinense ZZ0214-1 TaxID=1077348 RepID=A0A2G8RPJ1_9APHY|nr:hypothetical protein GSI_14740 [Ganoderma sinense ZZ0214-1]